MDYNCRLGGFCGYLAVERACLRAEQGEENAIELSFTYCRIMKSQ